MDPLSKTALWNQYGAAIDMLGDVLRACPDDLWRAPLWNDLAAPPGFSEFWYISYHSLFWIDLYLTGKEEGFTPPEGFSLIEWDELWTMPDRVYTKAELEWYWKLCRERCQTTIEGMTAAKAREPFVWGGGEMSFYELQMYAMRHTQEHAAQLALLLGQKIGWSPEYERQARTD
jgi:hypothetical protein